MISPNTATLVLKFLDGFSDVESLEFVRDLSSEAGTIVSWVAAEKGYLAMMQVSEALEDISWESNQEAVDDLLRDAEIERTKHREEANKFRRKFGVEEIET